MVNGNYRLYGQMQEYQVNIVRQYDHIDHAVYIMFLLQQYYLNTGCSILNGSIMIGIYIYNFKNILAF
jgi:hypothetical protein